TSEPKTRSGMRTIKLGETTLQELRQHRQRQESEQEQAGNAWQDNNLLFPSVTGTPFSRKTLYKDFQEILKFANLPRIRFHDLRHTAASLMLNHGVPVLVVSKILGHSKPSVTLNVYAHCLVDMQNEAANLMDEIVTPIPVSLPSKQNVTIKHGE
ncbi:MAG: tyrosine-type recombinase/integrase, partial [Anaerolineae bacterium]